MRVRPCLDAQPAPLRRPRRPLAGPVAQPLAGPAAQPLHRRAPRLQRCSRIKAATWRRSPLRPRRPVPRCLLRRQPLSQLRLRRMMSTIKVGMGGAKSTYLRNHAFRSPLAPTKARPCCNLAPKLRDHLGYAPTFEQLHLSTFRSIQMTGE